MPDHHLKDLWSQFNTSEDPTSGILSLRDSCSAFTSFHLEPSHIVLVQGSFTLHPHLVPSLTCLHACYTRSQIVLAWVNVMDRLELAPWQLKHLTVGHPIHHEHSQSKLPEAITCLDESLCGLLPTAWVESLQNPFIAKRYARARSKGFTNIRSQAVRLKLVNGRITTTQVQTRSREAGGQTEKDMVTHQWCPFGLKSHAHSVCLLHSFIRSISCFAIACRNPSFAPGIAALEQRGEIDASTAKRADLCTLRAAEAMSFVTGIQSKCVRDQVVKVAEILLLQDIPLTNVDTAEGEGLTPQGRHLNGGIIVRDCPREASPSIDLPARGVIDTPARVSSTAYGSVRASARVAFQDTDEHGRSGKNAPITDQDCAVVMDEISPTTDNRVSMADVQRTRKLGRTTSLERVVKVKDDPQAWPCSCGNVPRREAHVTAELWAAKEELVNTQVHSSESHHAPVYVDPLARTLTPPTESCTDAPTICEVAVELEGRQETCLDSDKSSASAPEDTGLTIRGLLDTGRTSGNDLPSLPLPAPAVVVDVLVELGGQQISISQTCLKRRHAPWRNPRAQVSMRLQSTPPRFLLPSPTLRHFIWNGALRSLARFYRHSETPTSCHVLSAKTATLIGYGSEKGSERAAGLDFPGAGA
ncbi:hypothetical protein C8R43DRAFT_963136 [Mycena crocata]|nr:hypothetical protein C8R43DRAFT_963136 [Mycena crocata]